MNPRRTNAQRAFNAGEYVGYIETPFNASHKGSMKEERETHSNNQSNVGGGDEAQIMMMMIE